MLTPFIALAPVREGVVERRTGVLGRDVLQAGSLLDRCTTLAAFGRGVTTGSAGI